jgi:hypothetical protein
MRSNIDANLVAVQMRGRANAENFHVYLNFCRLHQVYSTKVDQDLFTTLTNRRLARRGDGDVYIAL